MKVVAVLLMSVCCWGWVQSSPLIADVLRANNMSPRARVGSLRVDPLYEEANYNFQYKVDDLGSGANFGHAEDRSGQAVRGTYYSMMPDGRMQRVDYVADQEGFRPLIRYEGEPRYGPGVGVRMGEGGRFQGRRSRF